MSDKKTYRWLTDIRIEEKFKDLKKKPEITIRAMSDSKGRDIEWRAETENMAVEEKDKHILKMVKDKERCFYEPYDSALCISIKGALTPKRLDESLRKLENGVKEYYRLLRKKEVVSARLSEYQLKKLMEKADGRNINELLNELIDSYIKED